MERDWYATHEAMGRWRCIMRGATARGLRVLAIKVSARERQLYLQHCIDLYGRHHAGRVSFEGAELRVTR